MRRGIINTARYKTHLDFDKANDYGELPLGIWSYFPTANHPFTIEHWIKPSSVSDQQEVLDFIDGADNGFRTVISGGSIYIQFGISKPALSTPISAGSWNHWAATHDGTTTKWYKNGVQVASTTGLSYPQLTFVDKPTLGKEKGEATPNFYGGGIDLTRVWNVARTQTQIADNMSKILPSGTANLAAQYPFIERGGSQLADTSGNGYNIALFNFPTWNNSSDSPIEK